MNHITELRNLLKIRQSAIRRKPTQDYFVRKFRIYPTPEQQTRLTEFYGCARYIYNRALGDNSREYEEWKILGSNADTKPIVYYYKLQNKIPCLKKENEFLQTFPSQSLQISVKNLITGYSKFFKKEADYPTFKKKKDGGSITFPQGTVIENKSTIRFPKFIEGVKSVVHDIPGDGYSISQSTVSTNPDGKSYISVMWRRSAARGTFKAGYTKKKKDKRDDVIGTLPRKLYETQVVGIDFGLKDFATITNGQETIKIPNPRFRKQSSKKIRKAHRHLSKCVKGSKNKTKARLRLARVYARSKNKMSNFTNQFTKALCESQAQVVVIETLSIKNMMKNHKVARSFGDAAIGDTVRKLSYKAERFDKAVVSVNTFFPSSKLCSCCGCKKHLLNLNDRVWTCKDCGIVHDRDENAGRNIRNEGLRMINSQKCGWEQPTQTPFGEGVRRVGKDTQSSVMKESNGYDLSEATT